MKVFKDLKTRGVADPIAVTDGRKGIGQALGAVFPATTLQTCIAHLSGNSLDCVSWRGRKLLAEALRPAYTAPSAEGRGGCAGAGRVRARRLGAALPHGHCGLVSGPGSRDPVLRVPVRGASRDRRYQYHREHAQQAAQDHQDVRATCILGRPCAWQVPKIPSNPGDCYWRPDVDLFEHGRRPIHLIG